jgi:ATP-dependent RNA helicase DDX55/SPB4
LDFAQSSGFARTTPVQAMAIPLLMGNKDLVVEVGAIDAFKLASY